MTNSLSIGQQAEQKALHYLQCQGLKLIEKNWTCPLGEIDLIMLQGNILVFIEVRYRKTSQRGTPAETITKIKQRKVINTSRLFLQKNPRLTKLICRFDVIALSGNIESANIQWLTQAFNLS